MKNAVFLVLAAVAAATPPPPARRPTPERIDTSTHPVVELVTPSGATVLVESVESGHTIEMHSPDRQSRKTIAFDWKLTREVETTVENGSRVATFYDADADGLPDVRRVFEKRNGRMHLITSERLQWTTTPDEYDPRRK